MNFEFDPITYLQCLLLLFVGIALGKDDLILAGVLVVIMILIYFFTDVDEEE